MTILRDPPRSANRTQDRKTFDDADQVESSTPFVALNKNLMNYPLARDARCELRWRRSMKGNWRCKLPGDSRVELWLKGEVAHHLKRCPTAFDMNVLFVLLSRAQQSARARVEFASSSRFLQALGYGVDTHNRRRLQDAFELWSVLTIRFAEWYFVKRGRQRKLLRPPIVDIEYFGHGFKVTIDDDWRTLHAAGYHAQVPLPMPSQAAAQNLCLFACTAYEKYAGDVCLYTFPLRSQTLCAKIGNDHSTRNRALPRVINEAARWFLRFHGLLVYQWQDGRVTFGISYPKIPKSKKQKKPKQAKPNNQQARAPRSKAAKGANKETWQQWKANFMKRSSEFAAKAAGMMPA